MKVCVIGGANVDITARSDGKILLGDSNPGKVNLSPGGVARNIAHNLSLLGDEVLFLSVFGSDAFGRYLEGNCREVGMDTSLCSFSSNKGNSTFVSINENTGEMLVGVSDMDILEEITPDWLEKRMDRVNGCDVVVADTNLPASTLGFLIDSCTSPIYIDAVSRAKAGRILDALSAGSGRKIAALKSNRLEEEVLGGLEGVGRHFVTMGGFGLKVVEKGKEAFFPALSCKVKNVTGGGDALFAGVIHAGFGASVEEAAEMGLLLAKYAVECEEAVNEEIKNLRHE